jgi:acyl transferase domain-containing protein/acyl carrier protein
MTQASNESSALSPLQRAFLALQDARERLAIAEGNAQEPVAIVGIGCRVPGADDPQEFWQLLREGKDAIGPIPADRWDTNALFDADPDSPGKIATRAGGFLSAVDGFDPDLFGIAPREAQSMDPQQRLLLEVSWEALEHAGQAPDRLVGTRTGVFVGLCGSDYTYLQLKSDDASLLDAHFASGIAHSIASGRLSYLLGLQGPSLTIDTACSSSLVAIHLACQSLRNRECDMTLAGGVNLILSPDVYIALSHSRMLAPDGRCKTFDSSADGFARGEGCAVVILKRLRDALADKDRVLAVIRGSAVNQDGPSSGLTAPNGPAQEAVIREALAYAGLKPRQIGYIEAHGTGTQLGDPLEVRALGEVFGRDRDSTQPLLLGSVKTNIGHLEGAAGVAGLIKLVLALHHGSIPPHLNFTTPSPHIPWGELPLQVSTALKPWQPIDGRRIGGISSFGFSGTNAHLIVEEPPAPVAPVSQHSARTCWLLAMSARNVEALRQLAQRYALAVRDATESEIADICFTASVGRAHFPERATILAHSAAELRSGLQALANGDHADGLNTSHVSEQDRPRVAFLFTGQGSQYSGMARELYDASPVFRGALDRCAQLLDQHLGRPLLDVLFGTSSLDPVIDETGFAQPALFAVEYALTELWRSWGIVPNTVMGHSVGEYVAACIAGVFTLDEGLRLIARRGQLMQSLPAGGTMAAIFAPEQEVLEALHNCAGLSIAAVNGPEQTVISGPATAVQEVCSVFSSRGIRCQPLAVSHAFHSELMEPMLDELEHVLARAKLAPPQLALISNLTGQMVQGAAITEPSYWRRHARNPVRFADGLKSLAQRADCLMEIGPHPILSSFAAATFGDGGPRRIASLRKGSSDWEQMLRALSAAYLAGVQIHWRGVYEGSTQQIRDLPSYPFQRQRYWFSAKPKPPQTVARGRSSGHSLLGTRLRSAASEIIYESALSADSPPFVRQHRVLGQIVLPATAYLDTLLACARDIFGTDAVQAEEIRIDEAMLLPEDGSVRSLQTICTPPHDAGTAVSIASLDDAAADSAHWVRHAGATLRRIEPTAVVASALEALRGSCTNPIDPAAFYLDFEQRGLNFGSGFRTIRELWSGESQALGAVELDADMLAQGGDYRLHPVLLDGCLQVMAAAMTPNDGQALYLPIGIKRYALYGAPSAKCWSHALVRPVGAETFRADLQVFNDRGVLLADLHDVQLKRVSRQSLARLSERWLDDCLYETQWQKSVLAGLARPWSPNELLQTGARKLPDLKLAADIPAYDSFLERLEALCVDYVLLAMDRLGWNAKVGERVRLAELLSRLRIAPVHHRLFRRLLAILVDAGWLSRDPIASETWTVPRLWSGTDPQREAEVLMRICPPGASAEIELTSRVASELAEALRGEREPMQLLFPGGSLDTAERLYRDSPPAILYNGLMAEVIEAASAARAEGGVLRILEIGAGTGGTTAHVLPRLPSTGIEYTFTDVGPLFLARARERFGNFKFVSFQTLDMERDPQQQGFAGRQFDIIIASNVIHATSDLRRTLSRVRSLLVPGGLLAMLEVTSPQRWFDLTVGITAGWWAFSDLDLRPDYATLPRDKWFALLRESGFDACVALPEGTDLRGCLALQSLMLARAKRHAHAGTPIWLVFADAHGTAEGLAARLGSSQEQCILVRPGSFGLQQDTATVDPECAEDYKRLLAAVSAAGHVVVGVVHMWALDAPAWEATGGQELTVTQQRGVHSALAIAQGLVTQGEPPPFWIVTRGAQAVDASDRSLAPSQAPAWGLGKALAMEHPEIRCVCIDLEPTSRPSEIDMLLQELHAADSGERFIALRADERRVARLTRIRRALSSANIGASDDSVWRLASRSPGSLEEFRCEPESRRLPGPLEVEIAVTAVGLNFRDVLAALGMRPGDTIPMGGECSGRVVSIGSEVTHVRVGDEVMAAAAGSFASHVIARAELVQKRPEQITDEEAAGFSIAHITAEYCLGHLAGMRKGERVLIHAAAGGVGMAAVRLAQRAGAEIFATAGSQSKRAYLKKLGVPHVFDSRTTEFATDVLALTSGEGVDVVLNSLAGQFIEASFSVLKRGGRFVEIGKRGIKDDAWVKSQARDWRYFAVDWGDQKTVEPGVIGDIYARLVAELGAGTLAPLPMRVFGLEQAGRAFRFMAHARHIGKVVVRQRAGPLLVRRDGSYLITGGLSGLGLLTAGWLARQGAGRLILIGRRGVAAEAAAEIEQIRASGTMVVVEALDVCDGAALEALLERARLDGAPLRGVIHSAGVLDDGGLIQLDAQRFTRVLAPKVKGGWLLDRLTRQDQLDWFVLFASVAGVLGSAGQSNHSAANAFLDVLAHERRNQGLPALSIDWGAWAEVGAAADRGLTQKLSAQGISALTPEQGLTALHRLLNSGLAQAAVLPIDWNRFVDASARGAIPAFLSSLAAPDTSTARIAGKPSAAQRPIELQQQLAEAPTSRRRPMVATFVREYAIRALGMEAGKPIDPRTPLGDLGLDSLLAVELRNTLSKALGVSLPATLLFDYPSIEALTDYLVVDVLHLNEVVQAANDEPAAEVLFGTALVGSIESMSDDEVERQMAARLKQKA